MEEQPEKHFAPNDLRDEGILIDRRDEQPEKQEDPKDVKDDCSSID
jgi:hypothetical protein